ncbi:hypothetical protein ACJMK2_027755 [Sinanodonta woodiana]|uniref:Vitelline membrane outer layer protein 1 homolog n=1 Tax=Sinanodonta woodiana TaxID=1069815 RepID=A0ABD3X8G9_SINWO
MVDAFIFLSLVVFGDAFLLMPNAPRSAVKILAVSNGGPWGTWYQAQFCPSGSYAVGYNMKIQEDQHDHDDTGLNAISLRCQPFDVSRDNGEITSEEGGWGSWIGWTMCNDSQSQRTFLTAFSLQVEASLISGDDTAADYIKFMCRDFDASMHQRELAHPPGHGPWGTYGDWSQNCPLHSAICGIQTKIEPFQAGNFFSKGDNTALNDVQFICCNDTIHDM